MLKKYFIDIFKFNNLEHVFTRTYPLAAHIIAVLSIKRNYYFIVNVNDIIIFNTYPLISATHEHSHC